MNAAQVQKAKEAKEKKRAATFWRQQAKKGLKDDANKHRASRIRFA